VALPYESLGLRGGEAGSDCISTFSVCCNTCVVTLGHPDVKWKNFFIYIFPSCIFTVSNFRALYWENLHHYVSIHYFLDLLESIPGSKVASINEGPSDIKRTVQLNFNSVFDIYMDRPRLKQELLLD
jgi:hypothetical protein